MKACKRIAGMTLLVLLLGACGKRPEQEERIRISIEQPEQPAGAKTKAPVKPAPVRPAPVASVPEAPPPAPARPAQQSPPAPAPAPRPAPAQPPQAVTAARPVASGIDFASVAQRLTVDPRDRRAVRREWEELREKKVVWSGTVVEAEVGRRGFRVHVLVPGGRADARFNVVLVGADTPAASALAAGRGVRFRGVIHRAEYGTSRRGTVVTLREVTFL